MRNILLIISSVIILFASCNKGSFEQVVDLDIPKHESTIVLSGTFSATDTLLKVLVSNSLGILDQSGYDTFPKANLQLLKNGALFKSFQYNSGNLFFEALLDEPLGTENATYSLKADVEGFKSVSAEQIMPTPIEITNVTYKKDGVLVEEDRADEVKIEFNDPAGKENYYAVNASLELLIKHPGSGQETIQYDLYLDSTDPLIEEGRRFRKLIPDRSFDGTSATLKFHFFDEFLFPGTEVKSAQLTVRLLSLTKDGYLFARSLNQFDEARDNPFVEPVIMHNNIKGGNGIFALYSFSEKTIQLQ